MSNSTLQKITWGLCGVVFTLTTLMTSCSNPPASPPVAPTQEIQGIGTDIANTSTALSGTTKSIETDATQGMQKTPTNVQSILNPHWTGILAAVGMQKQMVTDLTTTKQHATDAVSLSQKFQQAYESEHAARLKAEDSATKELKDKYIMYSGILFFIALGCGALAFFVDSKFAMYGAIVAAVGAAVCIFIVQIVSIIPWIIGGLALAALGLGIYTFLEKKKQITTVTAKSLTYQKATTELVKTIEATKPRMTFAGRKAVFGDGPCQGDAHIIQSGETETIVNGIRSKMGMNRAPSLPITVATDIDVESGSEIQTQPKSLTRKYILK